MKACVLHAVGDLRCEQVPAPQAGPGEVRVRVAACGVCGSDLPRIFSKGTYRFPLIPGHEFAGTVEQVGEGVGEDWIGRRVAVFPLIPCRRCALCAREEYALCANYDYLGSRRDGGFAEQVCAPVWNLLPVPEGVSLEMAAMVEPCAVALHALRRGGLFAGESVAIFGAGPIGLMLAAWAGALGAGKVMLVDVDPVKVSFAREAGFALVFNASEGEPAAWIREQTQGGADVVVEGSGRAAALAGCLGAARPQGRVVLMGNPAEGMAMSQEAYWLILRKELHLAGTWNARYGAAGQDDWRDTMEAMARGAIRLMPLITQRATLAELPALLHAMQTGRVFFNKVLAGGSYETGREGV
jgi:L-iditol 2-dehydrogenase